MTAQTKRGYGQAIRGTISLFQNRISEGPVLGAFPCIFEAIEHARFAATLLPVVIETVRIADGVLLARTRHPDVARKEQSKSFRLQSLVKKTPRLREVA